MSKVIPGTPKDMGPPYGTRGTYTIPIPISLGILEVKPLPCPWKSSRQIKTIENQILDDEKIPFNNSQLGEVPYFFNGQRGASQGHLVGTLLSEVGAAVGPFHPSSLYEASWGGSHFFEGKGLGKVGGFCSSGTPNNPV